MEEIQPAVFHAQAARLALGQRLVEEIQLAAVVELPGDPVRAGKTPAAVTGEPGVSLPIPVALITMLPSGMPAIIASLTSGSWLQMVSTS